MAVPNTRESFKNYCLRRLGEPVIDVNVDDEQVEDRIDEALKYYQDYQNTLTNQDCKSLIYHIYLPNA